MGSREKRIEERESTTRDGQKKAFDERIENLGEGATMRRTGLYRMAWLRNLFVSCTFTAEARPLLANPSIRRAYFGFGPRKQIRPYACSRRRHRL